MIGGRKKEKKKEEHYKSFTVALHPPEPDASTFSGSSFCPSFLHFSLKFSLTAIVTLSM
jgi:hypothetical protein